MENRLPYILSGAQLPRSYDAAVQEALDGTELERLEGVYCGIAVFRDTHVDTNPTTGDTIGYSQSITFGHTISDDSAKVEYTLTQEIIPTLESHMGRDNSIGITKRALLALSLVRGAASQTQEQDKQLQQFESQLSFVNRSLGLQRQKGYTVDRTLLAPDACIYADETIGLPIHRAARNTHFIGNVAIDQEERASNIWRGINTVAHNMGFPEYLGYEQAGLGELLLKILRDAEESSLLDDGEKAHLASEVCAVVRTRQEIVSHMEQLRQKYAEDEAAAEEQRKRLLLRRHYGVSLSSDEGMVTSHTNDSFDIKEVNSADQRLVGRMHRLLRITKELYSSAKKRQLQARLMEEFGNDGDSPLQNVFWAELSRAVAEGGMNVYDQNIQNATMYIVDLPNMIGDVGAVSKKDVEALYSAFRANYSTQDLQLRTVGEFMKDVDY